MYRVFVPLDDSMDRARKQAEYVASLPCADEHVHAIVAHALTADDRDVPEEMQQVDRVETVRRATEILEKAGVDYEIRELAAPPSEAISEVAEEEDVDEIVMGGRKRSPAEKAILGSVTQTVILNADIPVTVTGGEKARDR